MTEQRADEALLEQVRRHTAAEQDRELMARVAWCRAVDEAVRHRRRIAACEAVGHFLREGQPGPSRFELPASLREAA